MRTLVFLALIGAVVWALVRSTRSQRLAWLQRLGLPGVWSARVDGVDHELALDGEVGGGTYVETSRRGEAVEREEGTWRVAGQEIRFTPRGGRESACELRLFDPGRIGIHGPGRERRVYERRADNVVALPRRA